MRNDNAVATTAVSNEPLFVAPQLGLVRRSSERPMQASQPRLRSEELFRNGNNELLIEHRGECYRLRLTRHDKLILNK